MPYSAGHPLLPSQTKEDDLDSLSPDVDQLPHLLNSKPAFEVINLSSNEQRSSPYRNGLFASIEPNNGVKVNRSSKNTVYFQLPTSSADGDISCKNKSSHHPSNHRQHQQQHRQSQGTRKKKHERVPRHPKDYERIPLMGSSSSGSSSSSRASSTCDIVEYGSSNVTGASLLKDSKDDHGASSVASMSDRELCDPLSINPTLNNFSDDEEFSQIVQSTELAIRHRIYPQRIYQGSSGSYFAKNTRGVTVGVFKPKDEEPYGQLNPKWTKWMHKHCCPCCFGRSCLVPNQGYLSEAGASLVDAKLDLGIVPKTRVVQLASETFNYSAMDRAKARSKQGISNHFPVLGRHFNRIGLPPKVGSFQIFMHNFKEADYWLRKFDAESLPEPVMQHFHFLFEKLVVLDYVIRNTDRGNDNWLIKYDKGETNSSDQAVQGDNPVSPAMPTIEIAAIDNGLAFPFKHPNEWRTYPFQWSRLPMADRPFSEAIKALVLPKLTSSEFLDKLCHELYVLFKTDQGFDESTFERQMAVLRGQILNLTAAMSSNKTPAQLAELPFATLERQRFSLHRLISAPMETTEQDQDKATIRRLHSEHVDGTGHEDNQSSYVPKYYRRAFFRWC